MQSFSTRRQYSCARRRAISAVELVGFLAALIGGIVLGSMYLGVDVQAVAVGVLEKADIEVPSILNLNASAGKIATSEASAEEEATVGSSEEIVSTARQTEIEDDSTEAASGELETREDELPRPELSDDEKLAATQKCWDQLNQCVRDEAGNRSKSIDDPENWQLFDYLLHRKKRP